MCIPSVEMVLLPISSPRDGVHSTQPISSRQIRPQFGLRSIIIRPTWQATQFQSAEYS